MRLSGVTLQKFSFAECSINFLNLYRTGLQSFQSIIFYEVPIKTLSKPQKIIIIYQSTKIPVLFLHFKKIVTRFLAIIQNCQDWKNGQLDYIIIKRQLFFGDYQIWVKDQQGINQIPKIIRKQQINGISQKENFIRIGLILLLIYNIYQFVKLLISVKLITTPQYLILIKNSQKLEDRPLKDQTSNFKQQKIINFKIINYRRLKKEVKKYKYQKVKLEFSFASFLSKVFTSFRICYSEIDILQPKLFRKESRYTKDSVLPLNTFGLKEFCFFGIFRIFLEVRGVEIIFKLATFLLHFIQIGQFFDQCPLKIQQKACFISRHWEHCTQDDDIYEFKRPVKQTQHFLLRIGELKISIEVGFSKEFSRSFSSSVDFSWHNFNDSSYSKFSFFSFEALAAKIFWGCFSSDCDNQQLE